MSRVRRALLSVSDKRGLVEFARGLAALDVELLSTGGTAKLLSDAGIRVTQVSDYTGFPEMLDGRVKTLHPKIHGGLLGRRDLPAHTDAMRAHGIEPIDLVVVNLYPFRETVAKPGVAVGDPVVLFGEGLGADELGGWCETISYEMLTAVGRRVPRVYVEETTDV